MRFSKCVLLLQIAAGLACLALIVEQTRAQEASDNNDGSSSGHRNSGGIFSLFASPHRTLLEHARRLIGNRINSSGGLVADGLNQIQMRSFKMFMSLYNKTYSPEEIPRRMALFFERRKEIEKSVSDFVSGRMPFMMRENAFIDWDENELKALTGVSPPKSFSELSPEEQQALTDQSNELEQSPAPIVTRSLDRLRNFYESTDNMDIDYAGDNSIEDDGEGLNLTVRAETIPATVDWRKSDCIAKPLEQSQCGACYAIATMSVVESMRCLTKISSPILSAQQIVDCATARYQNYGCDGGWPTRVFRYLQDVGEAARASCYPFVRKQGRCRMSKVSSVAGCTVSASPSGGMIRYKVLNNERDILYHVAKTGPVVTVMRASNKFLYYGSGIFDDPKCSRRRDDVDHAIVIVGYGKENGIDYWLIKNSWGTNWGQGGYGMYKRGTNACSIGHWGWVITS